MKTIQKVLGLGMMVALLGSMAVVADSPTETRLYRVQASQAVRITGISPDGAVTWANHPPGEAVRVEVKYGGDLFEGWQTYTHAVSDDSTGVVHGRNRRTPTGYSFVPAGTFKMGSPTDEPGHYPDESPHQVTLTRSFFMQQTEVTKRQMSDVLNWALAEGRVVAEAGGVRLVGFGEEELLDLDDADCLISWDGTQLVVDVERDSYPCMEVTWFGALAYCRFLSDMEGRTAAVDVDDWSMDPDADGYRLPTEAEWEYACRAGTSTAFSSGPITHTGFEPLDENLDRVGWYLGNSGNPDNAQYEGNGCFPVGLKQPNPWGLFDMHGNLAEWCFDWYGRALISSTDPQGSTFGSHRVARGGAWHYFSNSCRSARRFFFEPELSNGNWGFRPVRTASE